MRNLRFSKKTLVKVLAFTLASMVFTVGLAVKIGNLRLFSHSYGLQAVFADASGVFKGDAVKLAGVDVGRVNGTKIENGRAVVSFSVDRNVPLPKNSIVAIRWRNVLGQRFLYLYPGSVGPDFKNGDTIPVTQTEDAGDLGQFLNRLGPILKAIDPAKANAFLDAMNTALSGNEVAVRQLLDDGALLAGRLGAQDTQIQSLIGSTDTVLSTYAKQDSSIGQILDSLDQLGARLQGMTGDINSVVTNFADVQQQLDRLLKSNRGNIDASLQSLNAVLGLLSRNKQGLERTLCTLPAGVAGYFQTTSWGEWFNVRVVEVILKDNNSQVVSRANELEQRPPAPPPYSKCTQAGSKPPSNGSQSGSGGGANGNAGVNAVPSGFEDVGSLVRYVTGGSRG